MSCCAAWEALDRHLHSEWRWQVLHNVAHSRVPFSARWLARTAHLDRPDADALARAAEVMGWIKVDGHLWIGLLEKGEAR